MRLALTLALSIAAAAWAAGKKTPGFSPPDLESLPAKQTISKVTVGAKAYDTEALAKEAFGKVDPNRYGVLPVWMVIRNGSAGAIKLDVRAVYIDLDKNRIEATPAAEVQYANAPSKPKLGTSPLPPIFGSGVKKNPLAAIEIESRAFAAKILPPGDSASGFVYFQTDHRGGATLYLTGLRVAATGEDLFYFEVPLEAPGR